MLHAHVLQIARRPNPWVTRAITLVIVLSCVLLTSGLLLADSGTEVTVSVRDEAGTPLPDVEILLTALDTSEKPLSGREPASKKTTKKGIAIFPFLAWNGQGEGRYGIAVKMDGMYIREFHLLSRGSAGEHGTGTLLQDDQGKISQRQSPPPMIAKPGGRIKLDLTLAKLGAPAAAAPASAEAQTAPTPAPAAPSDPLSAAKALAAQEKYPEAEAAFQALIAADPRAEYEFELARVYHSQDKNGDERASLMRVLAKDADYPGAHYMLGKMAYQNGRSAEAVKELEAETIAHPEDAACKATLAMIYKELGRTGDALKLYEGIVATDPQNADALVSLGGLYAAQGDLKKSEEAYGKVAAIDPARADQIYYKVGMAIADQQDISGTERLRAADAFRRALELNPKHAKAHRELGYALMGLGKMDEAKGHLKSYLDLTPGAPDAASIKQFLKGS